jgi:hypothetical protein
MPLLGEDRVITHVFRADTTDLLQRVGIGSFGAMKKMAGIRLRMNQRLRQYIDKFGNVFEHVSKLRHG